MGNTRKVKIKYSIDIVLEMLITGIYIILTLQREITFVTVKIVHRSDLDLRPSKLNSLILRPARI